MSFSACEDSTPPSEKRDTAYTNRTNEELRRKVGYPRVRDSLELRNIKRRYETLDDPNKVGWVYLIDHGLIFAEYQVKGKVSSLNSQFTNPKQVVCRDGSGGYACGEVDQAEPDGSYGENPEGIFFYTADGIYVEWAGNYQYSDERLEIQQPEQNVLTKQVR